MAIKKNNISCGTCAHYRTPMCGQLPGDVPCGYWKPNSNMMSLDNTTSCLESPQKETCTDCTCGDKEDVEKLAAAHWAWMFGLLEAGRVELTVELVEYLVTTSMVHGYKHGQEAAKKGEN